MAKKQTKHLRAVMYTSVFVTSAAWMCAAAYHIMYREFWVIGVMMALVSLTVLCVVYALSTDKKIAYWVSAMVFFVIVVASLLDQLGWLDLVVIVIELVALVSILLSARRL